LALIEASEINDFEEISEPVAKNKLPTEEELLIKSEKSRRRKHQREQKIEESKTATIQRLLEKQGSRSKKMMPNSNEPGAEVEPNAVKREELPPGSSRYLDSKEETKLFLVPDVYYNGLTRTAERTDAILCSGPGCKNLKRYTHSGLLKPVCSLSCYRLVKKSSK
jgi:INO80 complex subunit B